MKRFLFFALLILVVSALGLTSCRKSDDVGYRYNLPAGVQRIVPDALIDPLRRKGMIIHEGVTPPALDGVLSGLALHVAHALRFRRHLAAGQGYSRLQIPVLRPKRR